MRPPRVLAAEALDLAVQMISSSSGLGSWACPWNQLVHGINFAKKTRQPTLVCRVFDWLFGVTYWLPTRLPTNNHIGFYSLASLFEIVPCFMHVEPNRMDFVA